MNEQVLQRIDALAAKLGVVGAHLWEVLVRQAYIDAWVNLGTLVLLWALSAVTLRVLRVYGARREWQFFDIRSDPTILVPMVVSTVVAFGLALGLTFGLAGDIANGFLNPEYAALQMVLQ